LLIRRSATEGWRLSNPPPCSDGHTPNAIGISYLGRASLVRRAICSPVESRSVRLFGRPKLTPRSALRRTIVVVEQTTDALAPPNPPAGSLASHSIDQVVSAALMVTFRVVVEDELGERPTEVSLT
jgi:hypothetical protein